MCCFVKLVKLGGSFWLGQRSGPWIIAGSRSQQTAPPPLTDPISSLVPQGFATVQRFGKPPNSQHVGCSCKFHASVSTCSLSASETYISLMARSCKLYNAALQHEPLLLLVIIVYFALPNIDGTLFLVNLRAPSQ